MKQKIKVIRGQTPMFHKNTYVHYEIDYDIDRPECISNHNMVYYKRKITFKSLNTNIIFIVDSHSQNKQTHNSHHRLLQFLLKRFLLTQSLKSMKSLKSFTKKNSGGLQ